MELLAVVWSSEHFKHYLQGSEFTLQTDHQALLTALKENRGNKTYQSRLTRWVDRLLPFSFNIEHISGKQMGFADYFSRKPNRFATEEDTHCVINQIKDFKFTLIKNTLRSNQSNANKRPNNYDVTNKLQRKKTNTHGFCHSRRRNQSPHLNAFNFETYKSNSVQSQINPTNSIYKSLSTFTKNPTNRHNPNQFINVITRNRLQIETSNGIIVRRTRKSQIYKQWKINQPDHL